MRVQPLITHCLTLLGDPHGDYHTPEKMLLHANTALEDIATRSRTICTWVFLPVLKGQGMYGLPENYLETKYAGYYHRGEFCDLTPGGTDDTAPMIFREHLPVGSVPFNYSEGGNAYVEKVVAEVIAVPDDPEADNSGEVTFFSSVPVPTARIGDRLINVTDNAEGIITEISTGFAQFTFERLANGMRNTMQVGDTFRILSATEHRHTLAIAPPPDKTDTPGSESLYIYIARDHKKFKQIDLENGNDEIELGTEFNQSIRNRVQYYMSEDENGLEHKRTIGYDVQFQTNYRTAFLKANSRIKQYLSTWKRNRRRLKPQRTVVQTADWSNRPY